MRLRDVTKVTAGKGTLPLQGRAAELAHEERSFSLHTGKATYDFEAASEEDRDAFVRGVGALLAARRRPLAASGRTGSSRGTGKVEDARFTEKHSYQFSVAVSCRNLPSAYAGKKKVDSVVCVNDARTGRLLAQTEGVPGEADPDFYQVLHVLLIEFKSECSSGGLPPLTVEI